MRFFPKRETDAAERALLTALLDGWTLKCHRTLDGEKRYRLHPLRGPWVDVDAGTVDRLAESGLVQSNLKFPAAIYLLTQKGHSYAQELGESAR